MKILLTGASGFIGQHLKPQFEKYAEVVDLQSDLLDYKSVQEEIKSISPDTIVHLAARTEVQKSFYEQTSFSEVNYVGTVNLVESCRLVKKMPHIVFASTMEVYGWQPISDEVEETGTFTESVAFDENTIPNPNAPYAVAKYACEKYLEYAGRAYDLNWTAIRQTNAYGRKDNDYFVTEHIISQMLTSNECNLGYPDPYRNFIYIDDLLGAWDSVVQNQTKCSKEIFTIGPDDPRKISSCASYIAKQLNWGGTINWHTKPPRFGEIWWLNSGHEKITSCTGWKPATTYEEGIDKTIHFWRKKLA